MLSILIFLLVMKLSKNPLAFAINNAIYRLFRGALRGMDNDRSVSLDCYCQRPSPWRSHDFVFQIFHAA
jgi:hypothetical protein